MVKLTYNKIVTAWEFRRISAHKLWYSSSIIFQTPTSVCIGNSSLLWFAVKNVYTKRACRFPSIIRCIRESTKHHEVPVLPYSPRSFLDLIFRSPVLPPQKPLATDKPPQLGYEAILDAIILEAISRSIWPEFTFKLQVWFPPIQEFTADCNTLLLERVPRGVLRAGINPGVISRPLSFTLFWS